MDTVDKGEAVAFKGSRLEDIDRHARVERRTVRRRGSTLHGNRGEYMREEACKQTEEDEAQDTHAYREGDGKLARRCERTNLGRSFSGKETCSSSCRTEGSLMLRPRRTCVREEEGAAEFRES